MRLDRLSAGDVSGAAYSPPTSLTYEIVHVVFENLFL